MYKVNRIALSILLISLIAIACEGPSGTEGTQGPEGPEGPVGPAGEDGSVIYSSQGEPDGSIGDLGDYYLNQDTGELYGPKDDSGWGNPIIVLMGEDGQDGADGSDGEDGSQIYSGSGEPDAELGTEGDFYLNKDEYDLYGPKTSKGWESPLNLKGADGNANVTRFIFPSHDYYYNSSYSYHEVDVTNTEMLESAWLVYLVRHFSTRIDTYPVPGWGIAGDTYYRVAHRIYDDTPNQFTIYANEGPGEYHDNIYIIRIEASDTEDMTKQKAENILPDDLDTSNYQEVAKYYGFYK